MKVFLGWIAQCKGVENILNISWGHFCKDKVALTLCFLIIVMAVLIAVV